MAKFDESKIINSLHRDKAEVGKKYYCSDNIGKLKEYVENGCALLKLISVKSDDVYAPFYAGSHWQFIYPYEEAPKKRMTIEQLSEWLAKGNGVRKYRECNTIASGMVFDECHSNEEVGEDIVIRYWNSDEWIEPTVDIYERDCVNRISQRSRK